MSNRLREALELEAQTTRVPPSMKSDIRLALDRKLKRRRRRRHFVQAALLLLIAGTLLVLLRMC